jgi:EmrB/QacA subfamily drug resistance transporter
MASRTDEPMGAEAPPTPAPGRHRAWVLVAASTASFMVALDLLVVTTALDTIRADLDASAAGLQWTVTAYSVTFAASLMTGAALGDRFGRRRMLAVGLALFAVGSGGAAASGDLGTLVGARVVQGFGGAIILPLGLAVVTSAFPPDRRAAAIGALEGFTGLAVIAGPVVGGVVAQYLAWEWIFWINVPIALAAIPLVRLVVVESHGPDRSVDVGGLLLVSGAALGTVWGMVRGSDAGWTSPEIVSALSAGVLLAVAFVAWEQRVAEPMVPLRFFRSRSFSFGAGASFLFVASLYGSVFFVAQFVQIVLGEGSFGAGLRLLPWTSCLLIVAPLAGTLADRVGHRPVLSVGLLLQATGTGWLALTAGDQVGYWQIVPPLVVAGIGASAAIPVSQAAIVGAVSTAEVGKAAGANNMLQELGGAFGVAAAVATFAAAGGYVTPGEFADGFSAAMGVAAGFAALGFLVALGLPPRPREPEDDAPGRGSPSAAGALDPAAAAPVGHSTR